MYIHLKPVSCLEYPNITSNLNTYLLISRHTRDTLYFTLATLQRDNCWWHRTQDGGEVDWCACTNALSVVSFAKQSVDATDRELKSCAAGTGLCLALKTQFNIKNGNSDF